MSAATEDRSGLLDPVHGMVVNKRRFLVAASTQIFAHTLVSTDATGYLVPAADVAGQSGRKVWYALEGADNSAGAAGALEIEVMIRGTSNPDKGTLVQADVGNIAYVADDSTVTSTPAQNNRPVGTVLAVGANRASVQIG